MQPDKVIFIRRVLQVVQRGGRADFLTAFTVAKAEAIEQAEEVGILMVHNAVIHGCPHAARPERRGDWRMMTMGYFIFVTACCRVFPHLA